MSVTIPRAELHEIARRHGVDYDLDFDPDIKWVRANVAWLRSDLQSGEPHADRLLAEADDLEALADRHEKGAAA